MCDPSWNEEIGTITQNPHGTADIILDNSCFDTVLKIVRNITTSKPLHENAEFVKTLKCQTLNFKIFGLL
jgi:hypothetical protein